MTKKLSELIAITNKERQYERQEFSYPDLIDPNLQGTTRGRLKSLTDIDLFDKETRPCTKCGKEAEIHFDSLIDGVPPDKIESCSYCGHFGSIE